MIQSKYIIKGQVADSTPFDDDNCPVCKLGDTVQEALDTLKARLPLCGLVQIRCVPKPGGGFVLLGITHLIDQNICNLTTEVC